MADSTIIIIGAGPAGIAAACAAAKHGAKVRVLDDNAASGGQIWRGGRRAAKTGQARKWLDRFAASGAQIMEATQVIAAIRPGLLLAESRGSVMEISYDKLILATGARELFLPFPGWTLPGVMGVGGTQALVKGGMPIKGKRVLIAGSGPLLLAAAAHLKSEGAKVVMIAEQAPMASLARFGLGLFASPGKLFQAIGLNGSLIGIPYKFSAWVTSVERSGEALRATVYVKSKTRHIECDYLACAFGLVANVELARAVGCAIHANGTVDIDRNQATSTDNVFAAGELTGIGGVDKSLAEGTVAGTAAAGADATPHYAARDATAGFANRLNAAFALRDDIKKLAASDTIICRCEDVRLGQLSGFISARDAKLQTRCGMGACQGRICGTILREVKGWPDASIRPPIFSASTSTLLKPPIS